MNGWGCCKLIFRIVSFADDLCVQERSNLAPTVCIETSDALAENKVHLNFYEIIPN